MISGENLYEIIAVNMRNERKESEIMERVDAAIARQLRLTGGVVNG